MELGWPRLPTRARGRPAAKPRTQASLAVSGDGEHWVVVNASPDLRQQIAAEPGAASPGTAPS
jgi:pyrroloquinoline quinone biosynthesis protein B